jgi:hypothetical protein
MKKIYIAGPYTKGDVAVNVHEAIDAGDYLSRFGWDPIIPHLTHFWHLLFPHPIEFWYEYDIRRLRECDALLRLEGDSVGADKEVEIALQMGIPVYYGLFNVPRKP